MRQWMAVLVVLFLWLFFSLLLTVRYMEYSSGGRQREVPAVVWLDPDGTAEQRLLYYQRHLTLLRRDLWSHRTTSCPWQDIKVNEIKVLDPFVAGFLKKLSHIENVTTVYLKWRQDSSNLTNQNGTQNRLIQHHFGWAADDKLCQWIQTLGKVDPGWAYTFFCPSNRSRLLSNTDLHLQHHYTHEMYGRIWHRNKTLEIPSYVTYLHIYQDVFLDSNGVVYTNKWKIFPFSCTWKMPAPKHPQEEHIETNLYWEVFSIAQVFGDQVYHRNIEQFPRMALYFNFLKSHPGIRIHLGRDMNKNTLYMLWLFGLQNRVVTGSVRARVLYSPEAVPCGYINIPGTQALYLKYREMLSKKSEVQPQKSILVIRRTSKERRYLVQQKQVEQVLENLANQYGLVVEIYSTESIPTMEETMKLFDRAALVFGIHGAGLSNIMFCRQGTFVIEVLSAPPRTKMCFQRLAHIIGHRYYGIAGNGIINISLSLQDAQDIFSFFMPHIAMLAESSVISNKLNTT